MKLDWSSPTYQERGELLGLETPIAEIDALVLSNAVLIRVTCQDEVVALMSDRIDVAISDSILTPGVVTFTITSIRLFASLISSIVSLASTRKERVRAPAFCGSQSQNRIFEPPGPRLKV